MRDLANAPSFIWPVNIPAGGTATRPQDATQNIVYGPARGRSAWQRPTLPQTTPNADAALRRD